MLLMLTLSIGSVLATYPGPDYNDGTNNDLDDARAWAEGVLQGYYNGYSTYQNVDIWSLTEPNPNYNVGFYEHYMRVWYRANNWDVGWYEFPGPTNWYHGQAQNVYSSWVRATTNQEYAEWFLWWVIDVFTVQGTAYIHTW
jgi:hypothetical protein